MTGDQRQRLADHFPNVRLRTQRGEEVRFYDDLVKGKAVLISFMFTSCTAQCPRETANLAKLQHALGARAGRDLFMLSISVDPVHDTPPVLQRYAQTFGAQPGWTFATGRAADIVRIQQQLGAYQRDGSPHTGMLIYGNEAKGWWAATPIMQNAASLARIVLRVVDAAT
jgi:protein SCO1/2